MTERADKPGAPWYSVRPQIILAAMVAGGFGVQHQESLGRAEIQSMMEANTREISTLREDYRRDIDDLRGRIAHMDGPSDRK